MLQWSALQPYPSRGDGQASFADAKVRIFLKLAKLSLLLLGKTRKTLSYTLYIIHAREGWSASGHNFIYCCPWEIMCTSIYVPIYRLPDDNQFKGACQKSRRDERPQTGAQAPGNSATAKEVPKGRQRHKQFDIKKLCILSPILGLVLLMHLSRGVHPRL